MIPQDLADLPGGRTDAAPEAVDETTRRQLENLGYAAGVFEHGGEEGVFVHDAARVEPGANLYTSGHAAGALLIDAAGVELHHWTCTVERAFPGFVPGPLGEHGEFWRRVELLDDGRVLAIFEGVGLVELDRASRIRWASPCRAHHDLEVLEDGTLWVLSRSYETDPDVQPPAPYVEDQVLRLGADGEVQERHSVLRALLDSPLVPRSFREMRPVGDVLHTNAIEVLDGRGESLDPAFRAGNLLLSLRNVSALVVLDAKDGELEWFTQGPFAAQHDPHWVGDHHVLLFDNRSQRDRSRVLELDLSRDRVGWSFDGTSPFYSETCGFVQRLGNGNTLVTVSNQGHAFEVTREGEVVWEFRSPHRVGEDGELVANLFSLVRLPDPRLRWRDGPGAADRED